MRQNRRMTTELVSLLLLFSTCSIAILGLGYTITANTSSDQNNTRNLPVHLSSEPDYLLSGDHHNPDGLFSIGISTHKDNGSTSYDVEGGEAYLLVDGDSEDVSVEVSSDNGE